MKIHKENQNILQIKEICLRHTMEEALTIKTKKMYDLDLI
jgi:hypothetical protein